MAKAETLIKSYVDLILERRMREADVSDGGKVPFGSSKHIRDLKKRIKELEAWRVRQKRGSEARANYSRLISKLKGELVSAKRALQKKNAAK